MLVYVDVHRSLKILGEQLSSKYLLRGYIGMEFVPVVILAATMTPAQRHENLHEIGGPVLTFAGFNTTPSQLRALNPALRRNPPEDEATYGRYI
jgi:hypothetical protein